MCKYYAYIRVSTSEAQAKQTYERQQFILASSGIDFEEIFEEHISGCVKGNQREQFNKMGYSKRVEFKQKYPETYKSYTE